jgi:hypothetical protein
MNHFISLTTAIEMTTRFRNHRESILKTEYENQNILPFSETFDKTAFDVLLGESGVKGLRIYYGMDENLKIHTIIVGVNENNEDILPSSALAPTEEEEPSIVENGTRCPELCPTPSPLTS